MVQKGRVLYTDKGCEVFIEVDGLREHLVFSARNKIGFSGESLKSIEESVQGSIIAGKEFLSMLTALKDAVNEKAPVFLGYEGYVSTKEMKRIEEDQKTDKILKDLKSYFKTDEKGDAI